jgi:glutaredoxin
MDVLAPLPTTTTQPTLVKTAIPTVDLYVMSFCPYGVQAENIMKPVVDLLGSKTNLTVRYIVRVKGSDIESVTSLHGVNEAKEDARQLCVMKYAPEQYWAYVMQFNSKCYDIGTSDEDALDVCWKEVATGLGIDPATIETCAYGTEGMAFLKADEAFTNTYGVTGSPTIVINGVKYNGARNSEAFKQAICSAFETVPAECSTSLSTNSTASSGSC